MDSYILTKQLYNLTVHNYSKLISDWRETEDAELLAVIYENYINAGHNMRFLELDTRDKKLIADMATIYRANN